MALSTRIIARDRPVAASQIRTARSSLAVAIHAPPGAITIALTPPSWPVRVALSAQEAASQIRTAPSRPPVASQLPSGAIATALTAS